MIKITWKFSDDKFKFLQLANEESCSLLLDYEAVVRLRVYTSLYLVNGFVIHLQGKQASVISFIFQLSQGIL